MFRIPYRAIRDREIRENFEALERATFLEFPEYPFGEQPNSPTSGFIMFAQDNGAGKTRVMILFKTGVPKAAVTEL